jgi:hypothetical protein
MYFWFSYLKAMLVKYYSSYRVFVGFDDGVLSWF